MDKEMYYKKEKLMEECSKLDENYSTLFTLCNNYSKFFTEEKSIEALKKIKDYLLILEKEFSSKKHELREFRYHFRCNCEHDIVVKKYRNYYCLTCNACLPEDLSDTRHGIAIDVYDDDKLFDDLYELFKSTVDTDNNLIEVFNETIEEIQYEKNIKVYRRSK